MSEAVSGGVRSLLRIEGAAVFVVAVVGYSKLGVGWSMFALAFFAPDLALLGYLAGARLGAITYNATHSYLGSLATLGVGAMAEVSVLAGLGLVWAAHIGFDRALGFGLKHSRGFRFTHLGLVGRTKA